MMENQKQLFSDEMIRSFLLGELTAGDQSQFEEKLLTDDDLSSRVRLAELELCDQYVSASTGDRERQVIRERFLLTRDRREALQVSTALGHRFRTAAKGYSVVERIKNLININQAFWRYAFAGLILIFVLATALLVIKDHSRIAKWIPKRVAPRPTATATPQFSNHSRSPVAPAHKEQSPALPLHEALTPSVVLSSNTAIDSSPVITERGRDLDLIRLQLILDHPAAQLYDVNVMTLSGESIFSANSIQRTEDKLVLDVPTSTLNPGDYKISLTGIDDETKRDAGIYYFRVR